MNTKWSIGVVLFHEFELLDVFGPLEMYGMADDHFDICMVAEERGEVASRQGPKSVVEYLFDQERHYDLLLVPGGRGTRREVDNQVILDWLRLQSANATYVTSVCTGSALLARAGLLDDLRATTNKMAFEWATSQGQKSELGETGTLGRGRQVLYFLRGIGWHGHVIGRDRQAVGSGDCRTGRDACGIRMAS